MKLILRKATVSSGVRFSQVQVYNRHLLCYGRGVAGAKSVLRKAIYNGNVSPIQVENRHRSETFVDFNTESYVELTGRRVADRSFILGFDMSRVLSDEIAGMRLR